MGVEVVGKDVVFLIDSFIEVVDHVEDRVFVLVVGVLC